MDPSLIVTFGRATEVAVSTCDSVFSEAIASYRCNLALSSNISSDGPLSVASSET